MELLEVLLVILFMLLLLTVALALYLFGMFENITVKVGESPFVFDGQTIAYKLHTGPYSKCGHNFTQMTGDLVRIGNGASDFCQIGFFFDDPLKRKVHKLRYASGVIFPRDMDSLIYEDIKEQLSSLDYLFTELPKVDHVVHVSFPFRGFLSIIIATKRVYPVIRNYINLHKLCAHPTLEIYTSDHIYFILPLSKQDSFYLVEDDDEDDEDDDDSIDGASDCDLLADTDPASESDRCSNSEAEHEDDMLLKMKYIKKTMRKQRHSCPCETPDSSEERQAHCHLSEINSGESSLKLQQRKHYQQQQQQQQFHETPQSQVSTTVTAKGQPCDSDKLTPVSVSVSVSVCTSPSHEKVQVTGDRKLSSSSTQGSNSSFEEITGNEIASIS